MMIETLEVVGDSIVINGREYDFSEIEDGSTVNGRDDIPDDFFAGEVGRRDGEIYLTLLLPHGPSPSNAVAFPEEIHVTRDGSVDLPKDPRPVLQEIEEEVENEVEA